jgi:hypothetical protein
MTVMLKTTEPITVPAPVSTLALRKTPTREEMSSGADVPAAIRVAPAMLRNNHHHASATKIGEYAIILELETADLRAGQGGGWATWPVSCSAR